eukprot:4960777-Alexandrium_andersonii.AAC.1
MSASLVGSEMCIRDRAAASAPSRAPAETLPAGLGRARRAVGEIEDEERAVSYTHLTLPTICSV